MPSSRGARVAAAWGAAVVLASAVLAVLGYRTRDPDSLLYAAIAAQLSTQPPSTWIAPSWPPGWYGQGRFREHPVGVFVLPALLARAGYPAQQAAYAVNACYQVLALLLLPLLAASFVQAPDARRLAWLLQLLPVAFVYRVRANQEPALLLLLLLALYATERSRESPRFGLLTAAALGGVMLVKGLTVLPALLACAAWLAVRGLVERKRTGPAWWGLLGALVLLFVTAWAYEAAYLRATGESFLDYYAGRATRADPNPASAVSDTLYNVVWYAGRVLWMAARQRRRVLRARRRAVHGAGRVRLRRRVQPRRAARGALHLPGLLPGRRLRRATRDAALAPPGEDARAARRAVRAGAGLGRGVRATPARRLAPVAAPQVLEGRRLKPGPARAHWNTRPRRR
jgi:4-amino-4-deoxy-L-arabinose transferase-like glycosyltransferase